MLYIYPRNKGFILFSRNKGFLQPQYITVLCFSIYAFSLYVRKLLTPSRITKMNYYPKSMLFLIKYPKSMLAIRQNKKNKIKKIHAR